MRVRAPSKSYGLNQGRKKVMNERQKGKGKPGETRERERTMESSESESSK